MTRYTFIFFALFLASFAPASESDNLADAKIRRGDTIQINLKEDPNFAFRGLVEDSGDVTLPYLGMHQVAGVSPKDLEKSLTGLLLDKLYHKATVGVSIVKQATGQIYVYGAVKEPGIIPLPPSGEYSVPQIIAAVKGLTTWSDPSQAYVLQRKADGEQVRTDVDIRREILNPDPAQSLFLKNGDELYIPGLNQSDSSELLTSAPREVIIVGQVNNPGIQTFAPGEDATLMRALFKAGGLTKFAADTRVKLIRYQGNSRTVQEVDAEEIISKGFLDKDVTLNSGDMIIVPQKLINF